MYTDIYVTKLLFKFKTIVVFMFKANKVTNEEKSNFLDNSDKQFSEKLPALYQNRYCDQEDFSVIVCDGENHGEGNYKPFLMNNFGADNLLFCQKINI